MKKSLIILLIFALMIGFTGCGNSSSGSNSSSANEPSKNTNILIVYFSETGTTKAVAEKIAKVTGGDLVRIKAADEYSDADLDYNNSDCRANKEQQDKNVRPKIANKVKDLDKYDVVFIGHPIWWGEEPRIIDTLVETYDLSDKTVIDFCTSASSGIDKSASDLKKLTPDSVKWLEGKRFDGSTTSSDVNNWIKTLNLK